MKILLFGANGQVGWELQRSLSVLGNVHALGHADGDLERPVGPLIGQIRPDVVVNAAAYTAVDQAEAEPDRAMRVNAEAVGEMAQAAAEVRALLVHYSTDYVFDGTKGGPYQVDDPAAPLSAYGRSKLAGEQAIRAADGCRHLIFRTSWVYALRGRNFARTILERARTKDRLQVIADNAGVPTSAELIADVTALAIYRSRRDARHADADRAGPDASSADGARRSGTYHLVPTGATSWHGYASFLVEQAREAGMQLAALPAQIDAVPASTFPAPAKRPRNSLLDNRRLCDDFHLQLPDWRLHVRRFATQIAREYTGSS